MGHDPGGDLALDPRFLRGASDVLAIKVMEVIRALGLRIPEEVAVAGFDDILMSAHTLPPLTTVRQPSATSIRHITSASSASRGPSSRPASR